MGWSIYIIPIGIRGGSLIIISTLHKRTSGGRWLATAISAPNLYQKLPSEVTMDQDSVLCLLCIHVSTFSE